MSQEQVLKTLVNLGFDPVDAKVYVFLAKRGTQKASTICNSLKLTKQQLYPCLKKLQSKGIANSTIEHPARFSAISFERMLDLFIKARMEEAQSIRQNKQEILDNWQSLKIGETEGTSKFTVIEGRKYIYSRIQQMIQEATCQLSAISSVAGLVRADQFGIFNPDFVQTVKKPLQFRFLTELSLQNIDALKSLLTGLENAKILFEGKTSEKSLRPFPRMVMKDHEEAIVFISPDVELSTIEQDEVCLWTNCGSLVHAFMGIFDELWRNAIAVKQKIAQVEQQTLGKEAIVF
jgi:sugar-specific transcriptional regulator TrmB